MRAKAGAQCAGAVLRRDSSHAGSNETMWALQPFQTTVLPPRIISERLGFFLTMFRRLWTAVVAAAAAIVVCDANANLPHSRLELFRAASPFIDGIATSARYAAEPQFFHQYLYDQYVAGKATANDIWDAIECFKLPVLPQLTGADARYQEIRKALDTELRHEAASAAIDEDHQEYVTRVTHMLYKKYNIKPAWPKSIERRTAEGGFMKIKKEDL